MRISRSQLFEILNDALAASHQTTSQPSDIELSSDDRLLFMRWVRATTTPQRVVTRSAVVLLAAAGWSNARVADAVGVSRRTVALWKARYQAGGARQMQVDAPGRGRKPGRNRDMVARVLAMSRECPPDGPRWTVRSLAKAVAVSHATVQRVLRDHAHERQVISETGADARLRRRTGRGFAA